MAKGPGQKRDRICTDLGDSNEVPLLNALALQSLTSLFDEKERLFYRSVRRVSRGFNREGVSHRRSAIALLGLHYLAESGVAQPFDVDAIRDAICDDGSWIESVGDLGLLTWVTALCAPDRIERLFNEHDFGHALAAYPDGRQGRTVGIAWFLTGIAHAQLRCQGVLPDLTDVAVEAYHLIRGNQGEDGIFGRAASPMWFREIIGSRYGTFSDQIHAIHALTMFAKAFQIDEPLGLALDCANFICDLQGDMGQWWFLYDKRRARIVNSYPVCSLHQDGTAPAALFALEFATGQSFRKPICKGLSWVTGVNELGIDLRDFDLAVIWDSVEPKRRVSNWWEGTCNLVGISNLPQPESLTIRYEARPDHFGWLLYAFGKFGLQRTALSARAAKV